MQNLILYSLSNFIPETILVVTIIVCIIADLIIRKKSFAVTFVAIVGLVLSFVFVVKQWGLSMSIFSGMLAIDNYAVFFKLLFIISTLFILLFVETSKEMKTASHKNEHVYLILSLTTGAYLMASSVNLIMMYISLEMVSLTSYILAGYLKKDKRSTEAAIKYIIYGAASSGIMLYGMTLIYGYTATMNINEIFLYLSKNPITDTPVLLASVIMISAGFGYKISSVPFHFWTPDVYEGAPIPITAFLAVTSSAAGFSVLVRFFLVGFANTEIITAVKWQEVIIVFSIASMIIGNFVAVWQTSLKRLLAYSSIAQSGYILLGLAVVNSAGLFAVILYLSAYLFMNLGAFYVTILIHNKLGTDNMDEMDGLGYRSPFIGVTMAVFMFSLAGIPATVGFIGKFYIFSALINTNSPNLTWLAVVGLLNSVVSLFFYVKVLKHMFLNKPEKPLPELDYGYANILITLLLAVPTILFGLYFTPLLRLAENSIKIFGLN